GIRSARYHHRSGWRVHMVDERRLEPAERPGQLIAGTVTVYQRTVRQARATKPAEDASLATDVACAWSAAMQKKAPPLPVMCHKTSGTAACRRAMPADSSSLTRHAADSSALPRSVLSGASPASSVAARRSTRPPPLRSAGSSA